MQSIFSLQLRFTRFGHWHDFTLSARRAHLTTFMRDDIIALRRFSKPFYITFDFL